MDANLHYAQEMSNGQGEIVEFGPFRLLPAERRLERGGERVEIGGRALDMLIELVRQAGRVVSNADLMSTIWGEATVVDGVVRAHVHNLRKVLGDGVAGARYVASVAGRGYCFVAPVVRSEKEAVTPTPTGASTIAYGLPPRLNRMAGRDDTVRKITAEVVEHRFVTIVGAAGIGKTTVAIAAGHALLKDFGGAARFVELAALPAPNLVIPTITAALGLPIETGNVLETLRAFLHDRRFLLVLDNCEHVVDAVAILAEHLFLHAPGVHLLATSREALRVEGEHTHRLGPLDTPAAVQVFLERAAAAGWLEELSNDDATLVAETCRRLDGVPLAIELAASFVGQCGLRGIVAVLDDRLRLLRQPGRRTAPPRHQTLHALIAWSYDLLSEPERVVLRRLAVFVGTFPIEATETVAFEGKDSDFEILNGLVAKSLLSAIVEDGVVVYRLLETTRAYLLERLAESGDLERTSLRHALFFADRLEQARGARRTFDLGNVRAALTWCFSSPVGHRAGTRLAVAAAPMLLDLGAVAELSGICRQALVIMGEQDAGTDVELGLQEALAKSAMFAQGLDHEVYVALKRGVDIARSLGGKDHEVRLLAHLAFFLFQRGEYQRGLEVAEQNGAAALLAGTEGKVITECWLGVGHSACGHQAVGQKHCEESLRLTATLGKTVPLCTSVALTTLARTLWLQGQADRAVMVARQTIYNIAAVTDAAEKCLRLTFSEMIFAWCGEWNDAGRLVDMLAEHVDRYALASYAGIVMALRGDLLVKTGRPEEGCLQLRMADPMMRAVRNTSIDTACAATLAEGLAATGSLEEALVTIDGAIDLARRRGGTWDLPDLLRIKGVLLASHSPNDARAADDTLYAAIALAREQGALIWELRAVTALARHRGAPGDLGRVYARFTEGMETPDLRAARTLLLDNA